MGTGAPPPEALGQAACTARPLIHIRSPAEGHPSPGYRNQVLTIALAKPAP